MEFDKLTLSVDEAAALSGIGRDKLYELSRRADFPAIHLGRRIRIPREGLEEWIKKAAQRGGAT